MWSNIKSSNTSIFYVYRYRCPVRNEYIYIGKGKAKRAYHHLKRTDTHPMTHRIGWIRNQGFEPIVDFICIGVEEDFALFVEQEAIAHYGRKNTGSGTLLNLTDGGEGETGRVTSEESREKIRAARRSSPRTLTEEGREIIRSTHKGAKRSQETRDKMSKSQKGRVVTEETKIKLSKAVTGFRHTEETREKIRLASTGRTLSDEAKKAISEKAKLRGSFTEEHKAKLRAAQQKRFAK